MIKNICKICKKEFFSYGQARNCVYCASCKETPNLVKEFRKNILKEKTCAKCGKKFLAKNYKTLCYECFCKKCREAKKNKFTRAITCRKCGKILRYEKVAIQKNNPKVVEERYCDDCKFVTQKILCLKCGKHYKTKTILYQTHVPKERKFGHCNECKENWKRERGQFATKFLNEYNEMIKLHPELKPSMTEEGRNHNRQQMIQNNPMKDPNIAKKMGETIRKRVKSGKIKYKSGKDHHSFKGGSSFYDTCRSRLYSIWIRPVMKRDNFTCQVCGKKGRLQVHHLKPFLQILLDIILLHEFRRENVDDLYNTNYNLFLELVNEVVNAHRLEDGITVCKNCHIDLDPHYRVRKENREDQKNTQGNDLRKSI